MRRQTMYFMTTLTIVGVLSLTFLWLTSGVWAGVNGPQESAVVQVPVGPGFTYQGELQQSGSPANGKFDFRFRLFDAAIGGSQVGSTVTKNDVQVTNGHFTVVLDFGSGIFKGKERWVEIAVRPGNSTGAYTVLNPRQRIKPVPYALALPGLWTQSNPTSPNIIGGYSGNSVTTGVEGAVIAGGGWTGNENRVTANFGTVGGGRSNIVSGGEATVGGGNENAARAAAATVGGGTRNNAAGQVSTIGGGANNAANGNFATIGGGAENFVSGNHGVVSGGAGNAVNSEGGTVGGGSANSVRGKDATVSGGSNNTASGEGATISGGSRITVTAPYGSAGGGKNNTVKGEAATVAGGEDNTASKRWATVGGGFKNTAGGEDATVSGGRSNVASGTHATVGGGYINSAITPGATVGGGTGNAANGNFATVGGGAENFVSGDYGVVSGGAGNIVNSEGATVGGGNNNIVNGRWATVAGGQYNDASGEDAAIGGGHQNFASGKSATIAGGDNNTASALEATVGGGGGNEATALGATVPGGLKARADDFGQFAYASGSFGQNIGTAQFSLYVLRREVPASESGNWKELFLDGSSERVTVPISHTLMFDILIVARDSYGTSMGWTIWGAIGNTNGTTQFLAQPTTAAFGSVSGWEVEAVADDTNDALTIHVKGLSDGAVRWVAVVRTAEVGW